MAQGATSSQSGARPWNPEFLFSDRERWICIYPVYINSKRSCAEGRKIPRGKAVENPTYAELRDVCAAAGFVLGVENKVHPREQDPKDARFRGRIRIQLRNDDGTPVKESFPNRKSVLMYLGEMIPKLKTRQSGGGAGDKGSSASQVQTISSGKKKKGKKNK